MFRPIFLGVNIDHIATLRQARGSDYPDPVYAAMIAEEAGADGITLHLREDKRHIQPRDVQLIKAVIKTRMNLECSLAASMLDFAAEIKPEHLCLVPEKREEITTEGGLDVVRYFDDIKQAVSRFKALGSDVSLFIDADIAQIDAAFKTGASTIEIHTGPYAHAKAPEAHKAQLAIIEKAAHHADALGLVVNAGHGLHYHNVKPIAAIPVLHELNIGHAIMSQAFFTGLKEAVSTMRLLMQEARYGRKNAT